MQKNLLFTGFYTADSGNEVYNESAYIYNPCYCRTVTDCGVFYVPVFHTAHAAGDFIFFDIETTGLSADNSMCWLIGTLVLQDDSLILTQYFADSPSDEKELMEQFFRNTFRHKLSGAF